MKENSLRITKRVRQKNAPNRDFLKKKAVQTKSKHYDQGYKERHNELKKLIEKPKLNQWRSKQDN